MRFEDFQDGHLGGRSQIICDQNNFSNSESLCRSDASHQVWTWITVWKEMPFEEFQAGHRGGQLEYRNGMNLTVLNLHVFPMPPTKFHLNMTYHSRTDVVLIFSSWPPWQPSWILVRNKFSNSKSPCHPNASDQVWAQSNLPFWNRSGLKIFKMAIVAAILVIGTR